MMAFTLLWSGKGSVFAEGTIPSKGSITVQLPELGTDKNEVTLKAYKVGEWKKETENWKLDSSLETSGIDFSTLEGNSAWDSAAVTLSQLNLESFDSKEGTTDAEGKVTFQDLELGMYLIVQQNKTDTYGIISPFLAAIPCKENDKYIGELRVETKAKKNEPSGGEGSSNGNENQPNKPSGEGSSNGNGNQSNKPLGGETSFTEKDSQIETSSGNTLENEFELVNNATNELSEEQKLLAETFEMQVNKQSEDSNMLSFDEKLQKKDDLSKENTTEKNLSSEESNEEKEVKSFQITEQENTNDSEEMTEEENVGSHSKRTAAATAAAATATGGAAAGIWYGKKFKGGKKKRG